MTPAGKSARAAKPTAGQRAKAASDAHKTVARNRKATHDYFIEDRYEAGLVLTGTEVKALRMGRASLTEAWIEIDRHGEAWLQGAHIPEYLQGTWNNHSPRRKRKLLLHRSELERLAGRAQAKSCTSSAGAPSWRSPWPGVSRTGTSVRRCARLRTSGRRPGPWRPRTDVGAETAVIIRTACIACAALPRVVRSYQCWCT